MEILAVHQTIFGFLFNEKIKKTKRLSRLVFFIKGKEYSFYFTRFSMYARYASAFSAAAD